MAFCKEYALVLEVNEGHTTQNTTAYNILCKDGLIGLVFEYDMRLVCDV